LSGCLARPSAWSSIRVLQPELIEECLREEGLTLRRIRNTHGHADHIAGNEAMKQYALDAPLIIGAGDAPMLADAEKT
jgi:hydroxyacylglutathione hydrolase